MPPTLKPGTIIRETLTLQRDLLNGLKISELSRWTGDSEAREKLLKNLLFGRIRWPKSNGKPLSATLNEGFTILHWTYIINAAQSQGGVVVTTSWAPMPEPFKFDEPDDADHYAVGFFAQVTSPFPQHVQPVFASSVPWPHDLNSYRWIEPSDWYQPAMNDLVIVPISPLHCGFGWDRRNKSERWMKLDPIRETTWVGFLIGSSGRSAPCEDTVMIIKRFHS
jgi:hypothetical protein